jgi:hypothetical protein
VAPWVSDPKRRLLTSVYQKWQTHIANRPRGALPFSISCHFSLILTLIDRTRIWKHGSCAGATSFSSALWKLVLASELVQKPLE